MTPIRLCFWFVYTLAVVCLVAWPLKSFPHFGRGLLYEQITVTPTENDGEGAANHCALEELNCNICLKTCVSNPFEPLWGRILAGRMEGYRSVANAVSSVRPCDHYHLSQNGIRTHDVLSRYPFPRAQCIPHSFIYDSTAHLCSYSHALGPLDLPAG